MDTFGHYEGRKSKFLNQRPKVVRSRYHTTKFLMLIGCFNLQCLAYERSGPVLVDVVDSLNVFKL